MYLIQIFLRYTLFFISVSISLKSQTIKEIKLGNQIWMLNNLNVDKFRNGDNIPQAKSPEEWKKARDKKQPAWCYYNNDPRNGNKYGRLYNWYAINDARGLAPVGWHIPTDQEWLILEKSIGNESGKKFKGKSAWVIEGENGKIVLSSLAGGYRYDYGEFFNIGYDGDWWSSTVNENEDAWLRYMDYYNGFISRFFYYKGLGLSVRCVKD
jgi:uncharacterized protein (TIGR02145 family)